jgi:hypothetical protein
MACGGAVSVRQHAGGQGGVPVVWQGAPHRGAPPRLAYERNQSVRGGANDELREGKQGRGKAHR